MRGVNHLVMLVIAYFLLLHGCVQERQDVTPARPSPLGQLRDTLRWNVTRDASDAGKTSIDLLLAKNGDENSIYFVTKKDFDLIIFCDDPPLKRCAKGLGGFFTTMEPDLDGDYSRFEPFRPYTLNQNKKSVDIAVIGVANGQVSVESRFAIIQEN